MQQRVIFHVDVNSAFLSWEAVENLKNGGTEDYRNMLCAVGGDIASRHGIILAKSTLTKPYGVETGESIVNALKKCPKMKIISPNRGIYSKYSHALMDILHTYTDKVEQFSVDEAFLDMTGTSLLFGEPQEAADKIRTQVKNELGFTVNVGISSNKLLAKMASDFKKPDRTHTLFPEEIPDKMWILPVGDLFFVGKNSALKLNSMGIRTIGDLAKFDKTTLINIMKKHGEYMWYAANGIDDSEVVTERADAKGYSHSTTLPYDVADIKEAEDILRNLTEKVAVRLRNDGVRAKTVTVQIRYSDLSNSSHQCAMETPTDITDEIYGYVVRLFSEKWDKTPVRLLGVHVGNVTDEREYRQMSLFDNTDYEKLKKLDSALDIINSKFGKGSVKRASGLDNTKKEGK